MRKALVIALLAGACGGHQTTGGGGGGAAAAAFPGGQFVPAKPTYVLAARTFRDAQLSFYDVMDIWGMAVGGEMAEASSALQGILGVDPFSPDSVASIGVDLKGSMIAFSEDIDPTVVVHLSDPAAMQAFLDKERGRGLKMTSTVVDGIEVFSASIEAELTLSWAIDKDWLWVHFGMGGGPLGMWFSASHHPAGGASWIPNWNWAAKTDAGLRGFVDLRDVAAVVAARAPEAAACAQQFTSIERVGVAASSDGKQVNARITVDVGAGAQAIGAGLLAPPPGWNGASNGVPAAAQWNLGARSVLGWITPCLGRGNAGQLGSLVDETGVITGRAIVVQFDPDDKSGVGVVSADLEQSRFINAQLDQVPMRSHLEKNRTFGIYNGKHLSIPFVATADYVLQDRLFIAAMGDGMLAKVGSGAAGSGNSVVASIDVLPAGLKPDVWQWLFEQIGAPSPKRLAQRLQSWQQLHVGSRLDGTSLLIEANGARR